MNVTRTILVVDDNEVNRGLARDVLCFKGYVVHEAGNAQEALALIAEHRPDMVILDIQLPRVSGLDILADIRRSPDLTIARTKVIAATALARAIRKQTGLMPEIKWPNDILLRGKKVAGILTELSAELDHVKHLIIGIGVDVNLTSTDLPADLRKLATSLRIESGQPVARPELAAAILRELDADYARVRAGQFAAVADEWEEQCTTLGRTVTIRIGDRAQTGVAESLDSEGALLLRTQHGRLERIIGGDVTVEK